MKHQVTIACLMAATQALRISAAVDVEQCCCSVMPCMPTCAMPCKEEKKTDVVKAEVDVTKDVIKAIEPIGKEIIEKAGLDDILTKIVGKGEAKSIVDEIIEPIIDIEIADHEVDVAKIIETITKVVPDEEIVKSMSFPHQR